MYNFSEPSGKTAGKSDKDGTKQVHHLNVSLLKDSIITVERERDPHSNLVVVCTLHSLAKQVDG